MAQGNPQLYQSAHNWKEEIIAPRGRPRIQGILRFNIASDLTENRKFIRFRRLLGLSEKDAYAVLVRFWNYVASNHALCPTVRIEDADIIADFCWFEGNPDSLLVALQEAGFVAVDFSLHDWFTHQPLAEKIAKDREYSREKSPDSGLSAPKNIAKQREVNLTSIPPTPFPKKMVEWDSVPESSRRSRSGRTASSSEVIAELISGFRAPSGELSEADAICFDFCDRYGYRDPKQRDALRNRIETYGSLYGLECVRRMIGEIREDRGVKEPIALLHHKINQALA